MPKFILSFLLTGILVLTGCGNESEPDKPENTLHKKPEKKYPYLKSTAIICDSKKTFLKVFNNDLFYSNLPANEWLPKNCEQTKEDYVLSYIRRYSGYASLYEIIIDGDPITYWTSPPFVIEK